MHKKEILEGLIHLGIFTEENLGSLAFSLKKIFNNTS